MNPYPDPITPEDCHGHWPHLHWHQGRDTTECTADFGPWRFLVQSVRGGRFYGFVRNVDRDENLSAPQECESLGRLSCVLAGLLAQRPKDDLTKGFRLVLHGGLPTKTLRRQALDLAQDVHEGLQSTVNNLDDVISGRAGNEGWSFEEAVTGVIGDLEHHIADLKEALIANRN